MPAANFSNYFYKPEFDAAARPHVVAKMLRSLMKDHKFDTVVVTGDSGLYMGAAVATLVKNLNLFVIRKKSVKSHSDTNWGTMGQRWIFLDDLIDSGKTLRTVYAAVENQVETTEYMFEEGWDWETNRPSSPWRPEFVGAYLYNRNDFLSEHYLRTEKTGWDNIPILQKPKGQ